MASVEKICSGHYPTGGSRGENAYRRWLKRRASRLMRLAVRKDPESAPVKRPTRGWSD